MLTTKKSVAATAGLILAASLSACGGVENANSSKSQEWFNQNCAVQTANVIEEPEKKAVIQGPIAAPADLDASSLHVGYYTYDELNSSMKQVEPAKAGDTICLERETGKDGARSESIDFAKIEDDHTREQYGSEDFTFVRTPKFPDGVWINQFNGDISGAYAVDDLTSEPCGNQWWPTVSQEEADSLASSNLTVKRHELVKREKC